MRQAEVLEDLADRTGLGDGGEDSPAAAAAVTAQDVEREHAAQELGPGDAAGARRGDEGLGQGVGVEGWWGNDLVAELGRGPTLWPAGT